MSASSPSADGVPALSPEALWDLHGASLFAMACTMLGDESAALLAVTLGLVDLYAQPDPQTTLRSAARCVHRQCRDLAPDEVAQAAVTSPPVMAWLAEVGSFQRRALALCIFGEHTYREAAVELDISPDDAARLLITGLEELGRVSGSSAT